MFLLCTEDVTKVLRTCTKVENYQSVNFFECFLFQGVLKVIKTRQFFIQCVWKSTECSTFGKSYIIQMSRNNPTVVRHVSKPYSFKMSSRSGPRPSGTDGSDFSHREKVAAHYKDSVKWKSKLKLNLSLHLLCIVLGAIWSLLGHFK